MWSKIKKKVLCYPWKNKGNQCLYFPDSVLLNQGCYTPCATLAKFLNFQNCFPLLKMGSSHHTGLAQSHWKLAPWHWEVGGKLPWPRKSKLSILPFSLTLNCQRKRTPMFLLILQSQLKCHFFRKLCLYHHNQSRWCPGLFFSTFPVVASTVLIRMWNYLINVFAKLFLIYILTLKTLPKVRAPLCFSALVCPVSLNLLNLVSWGSEPWVWKLFSPI